VAALDRSVPQRSISIVWGTWGWRGMVLYPMGARGAYIDPHAFRTSPLAQYCAGARGAYSVWR